MKRMQDVIFTCLALSVRKRKALDQYDETTTYDREDGDDWRRWENGGTLWIWLTFFWQMWGS